MRGNWADVAQVVNDRMAEVSLSQKELADKSHVSVATIRNIQKGVAQERSDAVLSAIARALDLREDYLRSVADGLASSADREDPIATLRTEVADLRERVEQLEAHRGKA